MHWMSGNLQKALLLSEVEVIKAPGEFIVDYTQLAICCLALPS